MKVSAVRRTRSQVQLSESNCRPKSAPEKPSREKFLQWYVDDVLVRERQSRKRLRFVQVSGPSTSNQEIIATLQTPEVLQYVEVAMDGITVALKEKFKIDMEAASSECVTKINAAADQKFGELQLLGTVEQLVKIVEQRVLHAVKTEVDSVGEMAKADAAAVEKRVLQVVKTEVDSVGDMAKADAAAVEKRVLESLKADAVDLEKRMFEWVKAETAKVGQQVTTKVIAAVEMVKATYAGETHLTGDNTRMSSVEQSMGNISSRIQELTAVEQRVMAALAAHESRIQELTAVEQRVMAALAAHMRIINDPLARQLTNVQGELGRMCGLFGQLAAPPAAPSGEEVTVALAPEPVDVLPVEQAQINPNDRIVIE
jgi:hypothetical protein